MTADLGPHHALFGLHGRVAVVTGASRNIGAAIARALADAGADLLLVARAEPPLRTLADSIQEDTGCTVEILARDVAAPGVAAELVAYAADRLPPVDILVNNAYSAGSARGSLFDLDAAVWDDVLAVNVLAPFRLCQAFGRRMLSGAGGSIINVVSGSGLLPAPGMGPYGSSKAALWMMTRYLAAEGAPTVRVNALCPGLVSESGEPRSDTQRAVLPDVPMGRVGRPEEIAGAAVYLASPAASYTTGELLVVNGGRPW